MLHAQLAPVTQRSSLVDAAAAVRLPYGVIIFSEAVEGLSFMPFLWNVVTPVPTLFSITALEQCLAIENKIMSCKVYYMQRHV